MGKNLIKKEKVTKAPTIRKKGKLSKQAQTFLEIMKESFGFEPAKEFIELYANEQTLYQELYLRYTNRRKRAKMSAAEIHMFWKLHAELKDTLKTFIKYSYPTLRTMDVKGGPGQVPIFNINLGIPPEPKMKKVNPEASEITIDVGGN